MTTQTLNAIHATLTKDDPIPAELWGRDHFSTLLYIETRLVDSSGHTFQIALDPHMRTNRRNFRVFSGYGTGAIHLGNQQTRENKASMARVMDDKYGSRLSDGTYVPGHDDWACIADMAGLGYFVSAGKLIDTNDLQAGLEITLSELGNLAAAALRQHRASGKPASEFALSGAK